MRKLPIASSQTYIVTEPSNRCEFIGTFYIRLNVSRGGLARLVYTAPTTDTSSCRWQDIIVLVWSLTDMESYRNLEYYLKTLHSMYDTSHRNPPAIVICANKCDCTERENEFALCCRRYEQYQIVKISADKGTGKCYNSRYIRYAINMYPCLNRCNLVIGRSGVQVKYKCILYLRYFKYIF